MNFLNKNIPVTNDKVTFVDRNGDKQSFYLNDTCAMIKSVEHEGKEYKAGIVVDNGDFSELYPVCLNMREKQHGYGHEIVSVDILEVIYDQDQEQNFLRDVPQPEEFSLVSK